MVKFPRSASIFAVVLMSLSSIALARLLDEYGNELPSCARGANVVFEKTIERESSRSAIREEARLKAAHLKVKAYILEYPSYIQVQVCNKANN